MESARGPDVKDLTDRLQAAYDKVKHFPEDSPTGWIDLIDLRNIAAEAILALHSQGLALEKVRVESRAPIEAQEGTIGERALQG
jgi:hypothetical protein